MATGVRNYSQVDIKVVLVLANFVRFIYFIHFVWNSLQKNNFAHNFP